MGKDARCDAKEGKNKMGIVELLECTLRDGSYAIDYTFTAKDTSQICRALQGAGFPLIEIGHGTGLGSTEYGPDPAAESDETYLKAAADVLDESQFGMFFLPEFGRKYHLDMASDYGMGFVRIGTDITNTDFGRESVEYAKKKGFYVSYNLMKSYAVPPDEFAEIAAKEGVSHRYVGRLISLAFLAPDIVAAIFTGTHPVDLTTERLTKRTDLPLGWIEQKSQLGFD